jgi:tetratricopeptide (TPR) repeat protein
MNPVRHPLGLAAAAIVSLTLVVSTQDRRKTIDDASLAALRTWIAAVRTHTPGRADDSVLTVADFSYETREVLNTGMGLFLRALMGWTYKTDNNKAAEAIVAAGHAVGKDFLKRAAILHSDAAAYANLHPVAANAAGRPPTPRTWKVQLGHGGSPETIVIGDAIPPLLMADRVFLDKDGQVVGEVISTWNWPFARSLIDLLSAGRQPRKDGRPDVATDPFVSTWYHATTAYMFASGLYGDATPHLHHASLVLPNDAASLFDRACYAEILGLPIHQELVSDATVDQRAQGQSGAPPAWKTPAWEPALRIPPAEKTNAEAERLFRRALAIDPSLVEARVRLARLLDLRGRHEEAGAELETALAQNPTGALAFYAHLFAGRAAQARGRSDEAARHYQGAIDIFPDAQSALLAASHLALLRSDVPGTLAPLASLGERSTVFTADPWWQYHLGAGRDAESLLKALWTRVSGERSR